jgi:hypothetical protein
MCDVTPSRQAGTQAVKLMLRLHNFSVVSTYWVIQNTGTLE